MDSDKEYLKKQKIKKLNFLLFELILIFIPAYSSYFLASNSS
jgi:hypothetical protein